MNHSTLSLTVLLLAASAAPASARISHDGDSCAVDSEYSLKVEPARLVLTDEDAHRVVELLPGGFVRVDGFMLALGADDRARVDDLERGMRALIPEVKAIAIDAVGIAFEAVGHASIAFAPSPREARESAERIGRTARELQKGIEAKQDWDSNLDTDFERVIKGAVGSLIGEIVGNVTGQALKVAFSGDEAAVAELEARAQSIEKNVEKAVEQRGKQLEKRADALCERLRTLDAIEARIDARLPDDRRFDLVNVRR